MKSVLLTGGAGYIGSHVANLLIDKGYNVTVIDSLITGNKKLVNKKAIFYKIDIADTKKINKILKINKFDLVMHFAGLIRVDESVKNPKKYYEHNYSKAKKFLNICFKKNLKNIIFSSTATVYRASSKNNLSEKSALKPINPYSRSKLKLENYLIKKSKKDKVKYIILRYFNVAGADKKLRSGLISKHSTHLIKVASEVAIGKRKKLIINGNDYKTKDGTTIRDYIHVSDLAEIHLKSAKYLLKIKKSNIFNCGYGKGFSVKDVINEYNNLLNKKIIFSYGKRRLGDCETLVANPDKFKKALSWRPKYNDLKFILKTAYNWEKKLKKFNLT